MDPSAVVCRHVEVVSSCAPAEPHAHDAVAAHHHSGKSRMAVLWGLSGTLISGLGFIGLSLFDQYNHSLTELQRDIKHFHEVSGSLVKKESMQRCYDRLGDCIKELQASTAARAQLERELESSQKDCREMARDLQQMRERLAHVEGRQAATAVFVAAPAEKK